MSWNKVRIGDFLVRVKEPVKIQSQKAYTLVTIRMYHKGVVKRADVSGSSIKSSTLYSIKAGQFIMSGIDARNGAFGIVPEELNGALVSNDFWSHEINTTIIDIDYFYWLTTTPQFSEACIKASEGTTNRQLLQANKFYSFEFELPSIDQQKKWVEKIQKINSKINSLNIELSFQETKLKLLRQSILQEAVQGKLVPQDASDEPAEQILQRIKAEKAQLIKEGKLKKEKELLPITEEEMPFKLPRGWVWCRLGEVISLINGRAYKKEELLNSGTPVIRIQNLTGGTAWYYSNLKLEDDKYCQKGDLLFSWSGTFGPYIWKGEKAIYHYHIWKINVPENISMDFIFFLLSYLSDEIKSESHGVMLPHMTKGGMENWIMAIPSFSEQCRIVAKVERMIQTITQLEHQVQQSRDQSQHLLQIILREAFTGGQKEYAENEMLTMAAEE